MHIFVFDLNECIKHHMNRLFGMHISWVLILLYFFPAANRPGFTYEHLLPGDTSSHVIDSLEEDKKYIVSIYAVYPQGPSEPVSIVGKTRKFNDFDLNTIIILYYSVDNCNQLSKMKQDIRQGSNRDGVVP